MFDRYPVDYVNFCRDDNCYHDHIHAAHAPVKRLRRGSFKIGHRQLVLDAIFGAIDLRVLRPFQAIYQSVRDDYGSIDERRVYRGLSKLVAARQVAVVVPSGSARVLRNGGFVCGGYIRYDTPLLGSVSGFQSLVEQADDLRDDRLASRRAL